MKPFDLGEISISKKSEGKMQSVIHQLNNNNIEFSSPSGIPGSSVKKSVMSNGSAQSPILQVFNSPRISGAVQQNSKQKNAQTKPKNGLNVTKQINRGDDGRKILLPRPTGLNTSLAHSATDVNGDLNVMEDLHRQHHAPVVDVLRCKNCRSWMYHDNVRACLCRKICKRCATTLPACDTCHSQFEYEPKLSMLFKELSEVIYHPCRYNDCDATVCPGGNHEDVCKYKPMECFVCKQEVASALLRKHFSSMHKQLRLLTGTDTNVKLTEFHKVQGQNPKLLCYVRDKMIWITLNKFEDSESGSFFILTDDPNTQNITINFDFRIDSYSHAKELKLTKDLVYMDIPRQVLQDWIQEKCSLNISVQMRPKRNKKVPEQGTKRKLESLPTP